jgi:hypothetical protein
MPQPISRQRVERTSDCVCGDPELRGERDIQAAGSAAVFCAARATGVLVGLPPPSITTVTAVKTSVFFSACSLHRDRPEDGAALSLVLLAPLIAQVEFDRDVATRRRALVAAAQQAIFAFVSAALGLLALILTVAAVQIVGAAIVPGCFGKRGLSCAVLKVRLHLPPAVSQVRTAIGPPEVPVAPRKQAQAPSSTGGPRVRIPAPSSPIVRNSGPLGSPRRPPPSR